MLEDEFCGIKELGSVMNRTDLVYADEVSDSSSNSGFSSESSSSSFCSSDSDTASTQDQEWSTNTTSYFSGQLSVPTRTCCQNISSLSTSKNEAALPTAHGAPMSVSADIRRDTELLGRYHTFSAVLKDTDLITETHLSVSIFFILYSIL